MPAMIKCDRCSATGKLWVSMSSADPADYKRKHAVIRRHTLFECVESGFWTDGTDIVCDKCHDNITDEKELLRMVEC